MSMEDCESAKEGRRFDPKLVEQLLGVIEANDALPPGERSWSDVSLLAKYVRHSGKCVAK